MQAKYCVDYLSHQWTSDDLLHTYRETRKEYKRHAMSHHLSNQLLTTSEEKMMNAERSKLLRFQNALWREMARNCTNKLSQSNQMIPPSSVSWQKESDITWLYGPMYTDRIDKDETNKLHTSVQSYSVPSLQGLKPVLKRQSNVVQLLPSCSDSVCSVDNSSLWSKYTSGYGSPITEYGNSLNGSSKTSYCNSRNNSISSISSSNSKSSVGVHFNPEIIEIEYQPEYPVSTESKFIESLTDDSYEYDPYYFDDDDKERTYNNNDNEGDDDDVLWSLLVQGTLLLKTFIYFQLNILSSNLLPKNIPFFPSFSSIHLNSSIILNKSKTTANNSQTIVNTRQPQSFTQLLTLIISLFTSCTSLITTWILFTSIQPLIFIMRLLSSSIKTAASAGQEQ